MSLGHKSDECGSACESRRAGRQESRTLLRLDVRPDSPSRIHVAPSERTINDELWFHNGDTHDDDNTEIVDVDADRSET
jgi:hypothetical protein